MMTIWNGFHSQDDYKTQSYIELENHTRVYTGSAQFGPTSNLFQVILEHPLYREY